MPQGDWGDWQESLFGCCSDVRSCCCAMFCPCCLYAEINELVNGDSWCCSCLGFLLCAACGFSVCQVAAQRRRVRLYYGIKEGCCCDCMVVCFFGCCAMAQERREIDTRGAPKHQSMGSGGGITIVNAITNTNDNKSNSGGNTVTGGNTHVGPIQTFNQPASPMHASQTEMYQYRSPQHALQSPYPSSSPMQYALQPQPQYLPQYQPQNPQYPPYLYPAPVTTSDPYGAEGALQPTPTNAAPSLPPRP